MTSHAGTSNIEFIRPRKPGLSLDMTPMIDIVFQLLIFFMLSSSFLNPSLKLTLPQAIQQNKQEPERIVLSVDKGGDTYINTQKVPKEALRGRLEDLFSRDPKKVVHLRGDAEMPYKLFVEVMAIARQAGALQVNIVHESSRGETGASQPAAGGDQA